MNKRKYWITSLFVLLFTVSISVVVFPCGIINVHGLFGEVITSAIIENKEQKIDNVKSIKHEKVQTVKGVNIFNVWFEMLTGVVCISFCDDLVKLPPEDTIVTLKVRMDN